MIGSMIGSTIILINYSLLAISTIVLVCNILHDPWKNAIDTYCYDHVGDTRHCFDTKEDCNKAQEDDNVAESHCYKGQ